MGNQEEGKEQEVPAQELSERDGIRLEEQSSRNSEKDKGNRNHREAGRDAQGRLSDAAAKKWMIWAAAVFFICLAAVLGFSVVLDGKDQEKAAVLEVDSEIYINLFLNRKGEILALGDHNPASESLPGLPGTSIREGAEQIYDLMEEYGVMEEKGGALISVRTFGEQQTADAEEIAGEYEVLFETLMRERQARAELYVFPADSGGENGQMADEYGIPVTRAAFLKDLIDKNVRLKTRDADWLSGHTAAELITFVRDMGYHTSYEPIAVGQVYEKKEEPASSELESFSEGTGLSNGQKDGTAETGTGEDGAMGSAPSEEAKRESGSVRETEKEAGNAGERDSQSGTSEEKTGESELPASGEGEPAETEREADGEQETAGAESKSQEPSLPAEETVSQAAQPETEGSSPAEGETSSGESPVQESSSQETDSGQIFRVVPVYGEEQKGPGD